MLMGSGSGGTPPSAAGAVTASDTGEGASGFRYQSTRLSGTEASISVRFSTGGKAAGS